MELLSGGSLMNTAILLLLALFPGRGLGVVEETIPESGGIVARFEGDVNITFLCRVVNEAGNEQIVDWRIQKEGGAVVIIRDDNPDFSITGDPNPELGGTFRTNLTILEFTSDLDGAILYCGRTGVDLADFFNFTLRIYREPSPPFGVTFEEISPTDVLVQWQEPTILGFPPLSTYIVILTLSETGEEVDNATVPFPETAVNFTDLMLFTTYEVTITALSENFTSNSSIPANFTTPAIEPTVECIGVPVQSEDDGAVNVTWRIVSNGGVNLTALRVEYRITGAENYTVVNISDLSETTLEFFDNFTGGLVYGFQVIAVNDIGDSDPGVCPPVTLVLGIPSIPEVFNALATMCPPLVISLNLSANSTGLNSGEVPSTFGFGVRVSLVNSTDENSTRVIPLESPFYMGGEEVTLVLDNLVLGEDYQIAAQAFNRFGQSEFSDLTAPIFLGLTVPVLEMVDVLQDNNSITVNWSYKYTGNITEVLVEYRVGDSAQYETAPGGNISNVSQLSLEISGQDLLAGEMYQFRISATNTEGLNCPNNATSEVLLSQIGIPTRPDRPDVVDITDNSVELWLRTDAAGIIPGVHFFGFTVFVTEVDRDFTYNVNMEFPQYEDGQSVLFLVSNLTAGETYTFVCLAFNSFGESDISDSTREELPGGEDSSDSSDELSAGEWVGIAIAIFVAIAIVVLCIVLVAIVSTRKRGGKTWKKPEDGHSLSENPAYSGSKPADKEAMLETDLGPQYEAIQTGPQGTTTYEAIPEQQSQHSRQSSSENIYDTLAPDKSQKAENRQSAADNPLYSPSPERKNRTKINTTPAETSTPEAPPTETPEAELDENKSKSTDALYAELQ